MGMKEIEIEIDEKTGEIKMETLGIKGNECEEILNKLQKELQAETILVTDKPEKAMKELIVNKTKQKIKGI
jgi:hypothetical protein